MFNSEYAVPDAPAHLTQFAALAEAAWMTGLERNADLVTTASYAPLLANMDALSIGFDAIIFDHYRFYRTPSYWNQLMWAQSYQDLVPGSVHTVATAIGAAANVSVAAVIGTVQPQHRAKYGGATSVIVHKIVNVNASPFSVTIDLTLPGGLQVLPTVDVVVLSADDLYAKNTIDQPDQVAAIPFKVNVTGPSISTCFNQFSVTVIRIYAK